MISLAEIDAARRRITPHIRRTPLVPAAPLGARESSPADGRQPWSSGLHLKLECLQVTGAFKARGAVNRTLALPPAVAARGLITASSGNHGLGLAYAAGLIGAPAIVYLSHNASPAKAEKLERLGATVVWEGAVWDDADRAARQRAERDGLCYVHPFAEAEIIAGQATVALEILEDCPQADLLLVAVGGGGLIAGVASAVHALRPSLTIVGVEPTGAPTLSESLRQGRVVELPRVDTAASTLAPRRSEQITFDIVRAGVREIVLVDDAEMFAAARWLWVEMGIAAELSGAAAVAALRSGKVARYQARHPVAIVCGAGTDGLPAPASAPAPAALDDTPPQGSPSPSVSPPR
jgi:threonine dehydratase